MSSLSYNLEVGKESGRTNAVGSLAVNAILEHIGHADITSSYCEAFGIMSMDQELNFYTYRHAKNAPL